MTRGCLLGTTWVMATKEGEAPIHVNVPKSWVEDIDWAIRHENEKSGRFPKMTRTDAVKNAISRIAEDARMLRKEEEARAATAAKLESIATKRTNDAESVVRVAARQKTAKARSKK